MWKWILLGGVLCSLLAQAKDAETEALTILSRNCAGCHQAADHPGALFLNRSRLSEKETVVLMRKLIETSQMPPAHRDFKHTADGKKILKWLARREKELKKQNP